jgi:spermidine/putrescine transport system permease protein
MVLQSPVVAAMFVLVAAPAALLLLAGFSPSQLFEVRLGAWSTSRLVEVLQSSAYRAQLLRSIWIGALSTAFAVAGGFALAYWVAFRAQRKSVWLALIVFALVASYLARIYAWRTILGSEGLASTILSGLGLTAPGRPVLLFTPAAVIVAQVNVLLPLSALILVSALVRVDPRLLEASRSQGYRGGATLVWVTFPLVGRALLTAICFTFFLATADYITPMLLGGTGGTTIGAIISNQFQTVGDYTTGSVFSLLMLVVFVLFYAVVRTTMRAIGLLPRIA